MYFVGLDIGGTKIRGIIFDAKNRQVKKEITTKTPKNKKHFINQLEKVVLELKKTKKIKGIGLGLPGIVNYTTGVLVKAPNLPFLNGWNAKKAFRKFRVPVRVDNDSRCFLLGEYLAGAAKGRKNIIGVTFGTGIGGGIIVDGKIYRGANNGAGEFGHMVMESGKSFEELGAKKAFLKYGDRSEVIGIGVANLINSFNPDIIVLGGGGIVSGKVKLNKIRKTAKKFVKSPPAVNTPIVKGKLGDLAQAIGAALLFKC